MGQGSCGIKSMNRLVQKNKRKHMNLKTKNMCHETTSNQCTIYAAFTFCNTIIKNQLYCHDVIMISKGELSSMSFLNPFKVLQLSICISFSIHHRMTFVDTQKESPDLGYCIATPITTKSCLVHRSNILIFYAFDYQALYS